MLVRLHGHLSDHRYSSLQPYPQPLSARSCRVTIGNVGWAVRPRRRSC